MLKKETFLYLIFGFFTTLINILTYKILVNLNINYIIANIIAWIISVIFAFITNKYIVFDNKTSNFIKEFLKFVISRLGTGLFDILFMFITISLLNFDDFIMKIISNIVVIILNYILSKFIVFKKDNY